MLSESPAIQRRRNQERVIGVLRASQPLSRQEIARMAGISYPTASKILSELIRARLVDELPQSPHNRRAGRPGKLYCLAGENRAVAGLVLGTERCELVLARCDGTVRADSIRRFATPQDYARLLETIRQQLHQAVRPTGLELIGLGLTVPGLVDQAQGHVVACPNLHQLDGKPLAEDLQRALEVPVAAVQCMHGLFLAERLFGQTRGLNDFVLLNYVGGLGAAICCNGSLLTGSGGLAGELGHVTVDPQGPLCGCGNRGCLETFCTDRVLAQAVSRRLGEKLDIYQIEQRHARQRLPIDDLLDRATDYLALAVATAVNLFNPQAVFLYGRFLHLREGLLDRLHQQVQQRALAAPLRQCRLVAVNRRVQELEQVGAVAAIVHRLGAGNRSG